MGSRKMVEMTFLQNRNGDSYTEQSSWYQAGKREWDELGYWDEQTHTAMYKVIN